MVKGNKNISLKLKSNSKRIGSQLNNKKAKIKNKNVQNKNIKKTDDKDFKNQHQLNKKNSKMKKKRSQNKNVKRTDESDDIDFEKLEKDYDLFEDEDFEEPEGELDLSDEEAFDDQKDEEEESEVNEEEESEVEEEEESEVEEEEESEVEEEEEESTKMEKNKVKKGNSKRQSIQIWEEELSGNNKTAISAFKKIQNALCLAVENIEVGDKTKNTKSKCNVREPAVFNNIIRVCLTSVPPALHRLFDLKTLSDRPTRSQKWKKLVTTIKKYLKYIILLVKYISEPTLVQKILKMGILPILPFFIEFPILSWNLAKQIAVFWCTSDEKIRILSVVALFRLITGFKEKQRERILKLLYISYVQNCKFTSPTTWPMIDFMRMSLAELYNMDQAIAYRHGFIYIRQLASHLRNAMLIQEKERMQLVYNWQFVHSLHLWSELLWKTNPSKILGPLIFPVVQICHGILTFNKTPAFYPLTFHISSILTELSRKTDIFIPVLPYLIEILSSPKLKIKPKKWSMKPLEWKCIIKVSKVELLSSAFTDGLIEQFYGSSLTYLDSQCHTVGFPELVFPFVLQLKSFLKKCKVSGYTKKVKQLLDKINENSQFISERRKDITFKLTDSEAIHNWEIETSQVPPPLRSFYKQWNEVTSKLKKNEEAFTKSENDEFSITSLRKRQRDDKDDFEEDDILKPLPKKKKQNPEESSENKNLKGNFVGAKNENKKHVRSQNKKNKVYDNTEEVEEDKKDFSEFKGKLTVLDSDDEFEEDIVKEMKLPDFNDDES